MQSIPLRRLVTGAAPAPDRILFASIWFRHHNNPRYAELIPRLERLDRYLFELSDRRIPRGVQFRALRYGRRAWHPLLFGAGSRRYRHLFTADNEQIPYFGGPVVSDVDDPVYTRREVELLNRPNVAAYVVTAERAARRFEELGVRTPWHVIPQGVSLASVTDAGAAHVRALRRNGEIVVGYMAAHLLSADDRGGESPLYNVDHLLELWDEIHTREPNARLWLIGGASERVSARCARRDDIVLFGRLPRERVLDHVANFDLALYPRTADQGIQAAKVAEYMGLGVPTVSYDYEVTAVLRETGAGVLVAEPRDFVDAVVRLAGDADARGALADAAGRAGRELDWDVLARRYETEILDRYLPRHQ
ncbi:MAG TPA: glycosyltransferase [Gaiellaceae bacterium]|nr:glycosyltransferase [Gaiellaceae bacterium]